MNDDAMTLAHLKERVRAFSSERSWQHDYTPKNLSMALAAEAAELMEHFLWEESQASRELTRDPDRLMAVREEIADILIYVLEFANATAIDLSVAVTGKISKNALRFPAGDVSARQSRT